jgi:hypothetical protein
LSVGRGALSRAEAQDYFACGGCAALGLVGFVAGDLQATLRLRANAWGSELK